MNRSDNAAFMLAPKSIGSEVRSQLMGLAVFSLVIWLFSGYELFDIIFCTGAVVSLVTSAIMLIGFTSYRATIAFFSNPNPGQTTIHWVMSAVYLLIFLKTDMMWTFWMTVIVLVVMNLGVHFESKRLKTYEMR